jgi:hypothetical protein
MVPSGQRPSIMFLVFPLIFCYENFPLRTLFWVPIFFHSYNMTRQSQFSNLNIVHDINISVQVMRFAIPSRTQGFFFLVLGHKILLKDIR